MNRLRIYRAHETQPQVARAIGVSVPDISRYETGRSNPTPAQMRALCVHYGTTVDKLMDRAEWDYRLSCPVTRRDKRRAGRGTGIRKITSRVTEVLASRIRTQCEADGLTLAQWMAICAEFYDERRGPGWTLQSYAPCISCGSHTSPDGCSCSRSADT